MKKISYNDKPILELQSDLATLQKSVQSTKRDAKNTNEYRNARKNIARVMTAIRQAKPSTEAGK